MAQMITKFAFPLHQNGIPGEFGCSYDDQALVNVTWHFLTRLEKLFPLQTIQQVGQCNMLIDSWTWLSSLVSYWPCQFFQVALMLADIPSALEECLKSVSHRGELQTLLGCRKGLLDKNGKPLLWGQSESSLFYWTRLFFQFPLLHPHHVTTL